METKHAAGPWRVAGRDIRNLPHSLVAADTLLARVYSKHFGDVAEEEANALLIAAAPELLEASALILKSFAYRPGEGPDWYEAARTAFAKATTPSADVNATGAKP